MFSCGCVLWPACGRRSGIWVYMQIHLVTMVLFLDHWRSHIWHMVCIFSFVLQFPFTNSSLPESSYSLPACVVLWREIKGLFSIGAVGPFSPQHWEGHEAWVPSTGRRRNEAWPVLSREWAVVLQRERELLTGCLQSAVRPLVSSPNRLNRGSTPGCSLSFRKLPIPGSHLLTIESGSLGMRSEHRCFVRVPQIIPMYSLLETTALEKLIRRGRSWPWVIYNINLNKNIAKKFCILKVWKETQSVVTMVVMFHKVWEPLT